MNVEASKKNLLLQKDVQQLHQEIFSMEEIALENQRLKSLMDFQDEATAKKVLAQIVAWDSSSDYKMIRINKGSLSGIQLQSPVLTADGLVGYIFRMTDHYADVLTIMDQSNRIDGVVSRTRSHGIVEGYARGKMQMKYINRREPVILNDVVTTSGLGHIYPRGIKVGKVSRLERETFSTTQLVELSPTVDFTKLEEVVILVLSYDQMKKQEWDALDQTDEEKLKTAEKEKQKYKENKEIKSNKEIKVIKEVKEKTKEVLTPEVKPVEKEKKI
jgi:rod shape-determining protein MreC